jgi:hypothetical protein
MANADVNRLMDNARVKLPGALDATLKMELFTVLREFFDHTNIWEETISFEAVPTSLPRVTNPEAYTYEIVPDSGTIIRLMGVYDANGFAQAADMSIPGEVVLLHSPNDSITYYAKVSKTVDDPVTREGYPVFPGWVLDKYGNEITDGLIGRMMGQIAKPYSSPQMAQYHMRVFKAGISRASAEATHGNLYRGQRWRFPQTFTTRRFTRI